MLEYFCSLNDGKLSICDLFVNLFKHSVGLRELSDPTSIGEGSEAILNKGVETSL